MKKVNLIGIGLILSITTMVAQTGAASGTRYGIGEDSIRCVRHYSLYSETLKNGDINGAYDDWLIVLEECPMANVNIYIDGVRMVRHKIANTRDPQERKEYFDLLMRLFDMRMQYFGNDNRTPANAIKGMKAIEMLNFGNNKDNIEIQKVAYKLLEESVEGMGINSQPAVLETYKLIALQIYQKKEIDGITYIETFSKVMDLVEARLKNPSIPENTRNSLEQFKTRAEQWFSETDVATCENLEKIFFPQFEENKDDLTWLKRVSSLLARKACEDSELFYKTAEYQHNIEPSYATAYGLAKMNENAENYDRAIEFYNQAIELSETNDQKGLFNFLIARIHFGRGNYQQTRVFANRALEVRPNYGAPLILIGRSYALSASNVGTNDFEYRAVYWAAVDKFIRARTVDPSSATEANNYVRTYSVYFPSSEEIFMQGFKDGESYRVGGWINENTTVRPK